MEICEGVSSKEVEEVWRAWTAHHFPICHDAISLRIGGTMEHSWNDIILLAANAIGNEPEV